MHASGTNLTVLTPDAERRAAEAFATQHAAPDYRTVFARLYPAWRRFNADHFSSALAVPHISIGLTTPRRFAETRLTTDYGGEINIVLAARVVFGTDRRVVRASDLSAPGLLRFTEDLLLGEIVKQYVLEVHESEEDGWGGRGPLFVTEANRIGDAIGLPPVRARRRAFRGNGLPVAAFWPWAFRPEGYYGDDVRLDHLQVAGLRRQPHAQRLALLPGVAEYLLFLATTGRIDRQIEVLGRLVDAEREVASPALAAHERAPHDASGKPLPLPSIDPNWLAWNGGCVRAIARGIRTRRAFDGMPILADALQDAGCEAAVILDHCRANREHTGNCWVLRLLTAAG